jgi:hypothetical protein
MYCYYLSRIYYKIDKIFNKSYYKSFKYRTKSDILFYFSFQLKKKFLQKVFLEKSFEVFEIYNNFLINYNYRTNFKKYFIVYQIVYQNLMALIVLKFESK